jgi:hypothetical protein
MESVNTVELPVEPSPERIEMWINGIGGGRWVDGKLCLRRDELKAVLRGVAILAQRPVERAPDERRAWYVTEPVSERGWQPIGTAPLFGEPIILTNGVDVAQGRWEYQAPYIRERRDSAGNYIGQDESDGFNGWVDCCGGMSPEPTHWMPLPAAPGVED